MAARTRKTELDEKWREKIRASVLINHLRNHVIGRIHLSATQIRAAEILLRKVVPDLSSVEMNANVEHRYAARVPEAIPKAEEWARQHAPTIQ